MSKPKYIKPQQKGANKEKLRHQAINKALRSAADIVHESGIKGSANYIVVSSSFAESLNSLINPDDEV